jgi:hypothetical protein
VISFGLIGPLVRFVGENHILFRTSVGAVAALGSAVVAAVYTYLTFQLVRAQREPKVVVYVCGDPDRQTIVMIRIQNIGRDVATDIKFKASRPIPANVYGVSPEDVKLPAAVMTRGPLIDGIRVLGPGDSRDITWGQFGGLLRVLGQEPIEIEFTYRHGDRRLSGRSWLDVASYLDTDASPDPPAIAAKSLTKMADAVDVLVKHVQREQGS